MNEDRVYKVLMATGIKDLDSSVAELTNCEVVGISKTKEDLYVDIHNHKPQVVIVSDLLDGEGVLSGMLPPLKREFHYTRFIYLAGQLNPRDQERIDELGKLVLNGIYDICIAKVLNLELLDNLIKNPKTEEAVSYLAKNILNNTETMEQFDVPISGLAQAKNIGNGSIDNVYVFTSVKPGTGKSFLSVNTACAIAKYGVCKENGAKPRIALVEADLQTLSIGTILNIKEDKKKNMKTAMEAISTIFDKGNLVGDDSSIMLVNKLIRDCMVPYDGLDNLHVLAGSTLTPEEIDSLKISSEYYIYLLEVLKKEYDIVIIDTNSSMMHITTYPLLQKAERCFYIMNLDINNVRNNLRYLGVLKKLNLTDKINWILNENIENNKKFKEQGIDVEKLHFTAEDLETKYRMNFVAKIPAISKTIFLNRVYDGTPLVLDEDNVTYTLDAKKELLNLADIIWKIEKEVPSAPEKKSGGFFGLFSKKDKKEPKPPKTKKNKKEEN